MRYLFFQVGAADFLALLPIGALARLIITYPACQLLGEKIIINKLKKNRQHLPICLFALQPSPGVGPELRCLRCAVDDDISSIWESTDHVRRNDVFDYVECCFSFNAFTLRGHRRTRPEECVARQGPQPCIRKLSPSADRNNRGATGGARLLQ